MLNDDPPGPSRALVTRLVVEPSHPVSASVLPGEDPAGAARIAAGAEIPMELLTRFGASVRQTHRRAGIVVVEVPEEHQEALAAALRAAGFRARPPKPVGPLLNESVPELHIPPLWRAGLSGVGVRVAIVDTGCDEHRDLAGRIAARQNFGEGRDVDDVGHGTHVAGIVAGAGEMFRGVAPGSTLVIAKALGAQGGSEDAVLAALSWASQQDVAAINCSLGGPGDPNDPLSREVDALAADGILVCVAAGNAGPADRTISSPGTAAAALTVGAADKEGRVADYSSRGPVPGLRARKPDVLAVGGDVTRGEACLYGTGVASARAAVLARDPCAVTPAYVRMSGTSMATPHVTGLVALLIEASRAKTPQLTKIARARAVRRAIVQGARSLGAGGAAEGAGLVDGERSLALVGPRARASAPAMSSSSPTIAKMGTNAK
ncbi:MAG: S8 family serine peptidase [Chloroflexota bacterium]|nr:S8 family serine peptidase [Chloroflexota bacterium]